MSISTKKVPFAESEIGIAAKATLEALLENTAHTTESGYHVNEELHPNNSIGFVEKHMEYLATHAAVNPSYYLSNLRLMTGSRKR
jgi:hypothetical protein